MQMRAHVLAAALALTVPAAAVAGDPGPGPGDPIDPPLTPKPLATTPAGPSSPSANPTATLALVDSVPLRLSGTGFRAYELVRLTVTTPTRHVVRKVLHAGAKGRFAVTFAGIRFSRCGSPHPSIVAVAGSSGRITAPVVPPECAMQ